MGNGNNSRPTARSLATEDNGSSLYLNEVARTIRRRARGIAGVVVLVAVLAAGFVALSTPQFTVNATLYLGDAVPQTATKTADPANDDFLSDFKSVSDVETQVELLQTQALVEQAILETGLNAPVSGISVSAMRFWRWALFHNQAITAFAPQPGDVRVRFASLAPGSAKARHFQVTFETPQHYRIDTTVGLTARLLAWIPMTGSWLPKPHFVLEGDLGKPAAGPNLSLLITPVLDGSLPATGQRFQLTVTPAPILAGRLLAHRAIAALAGGTALQPSKLVNVTFTWSNPYQGQTLVAKLLTDFVATQLSWNTASASAVAKFTAAQLSNVKDSLAAADEKLAEYQSQTGILDVAENSKEAIAQLGQLQLQQAALQLEQQNLAALANEITHPRQDVDPYLFTKSIQTGGTPSTDLLSSQLATSLSAAQAKLVSLQGQFTGDSMEVRSQTAVVNKIRSQILSELENDQASNAEKLSAMDKLIRDYQSRSKTMPQEALRIIALTRASDVYGQLYVFLMNKAEEADVAKAATIVGTQIASPAELPLSASRPRVQIIMPLGVFLGLVLGITLAIVRQAFSGRFHSADEVRRVIPLPLAGIIPPRPASDLGAGILLPASHNSFCERFRLLFDSVAYNTDSPPPRVIVVTSAFARDGRTTVATNLARIIAEQGKKVALILGDLRKQEDPIALTSAHSLAEWLATDKSPSFAKAGDAPLVVLGPSASSISPTRLLSNPRLATIFALLKSEFDHIIVDCPPLPEVADSLIWARYADLILSVVRLDHTERSRLADHIELLRALDRRHELVINAAEN